MDKVKFKEELTITELIKESPKASAYEKTLIQGRFKVDCRPIIFSSTNVNCHSIHALMTLVSVSLSLTL